MPEVSVTSSTAIVPATTGSEKDRQSPAGGEGGGVGGIVWGVVVGMVGEVVTGANVDRSGAGEGGDASWLHAAPTTNTAATSNPNLLGITAPSLSADPG
jgi:hypothetical protein